MKDLNVRKWLLLIALFTGLFLNSCKENEAPVTPDYEFYISNKLKFPVSAQEIKIKLMLAQTVIPEVASFSDRVETDIEVQKITYKTEFQSKNIQASGLVYFPKTAGNYPVLCFQNGTNTLHSKAPSEDAESDDWFMLETAASMGFIVVVPDYIGFGASSDLPHPYLHAESTTRSILDMLRAVNEISTGDKFVAKPTKDLFIFGYSQGGWATMLLQKAIEKNYSSEFNLIASSCAAGPYSVSYMNDYILSQTDCPMPYFYAYLLNSYHSIKLFPNPLSDLVQEPYASKIPGLYDGEHTGGTINSELTTKIENLITSEYRSEYATNAKFSAVKSAFTANSVTAWKISTPTKLYHGSEDELIPPGMSQKMLMDFITAGSSNSDIELKIIPGVNHTEGVIPVAIATITWFFELKK